MFMTPPARPDLAATLARLRERFLASSGQTVAIFAGLAEELARDPASAETLATLHRELHRTHGTSGSYGFHSASRVAAALEAVAARWAAEPAHDAAQRPLIVGRFAEALRRAFSGEDVGRRVLVSDVPDDLFTSVVSELLLRDFAAERVAPGALATLVTEAPGAFAAIIAGRTTIVPAVDQVPVARLAAGDDVRAAITSCCGPRP